MESTNDVPLVDSYRIYLSDDLRVATTQFEYGGSVFRRRESPALALFSGSADLIEESGRVPQRFIVTFRGIECSWRLGSGVWPPTLDSYALIAAVVDNWRADDRSVWDLGCGTGVLGLHLLKLTSCEHALLTDLDPNAVAHAQANLADMSSRATTRVEAFPMDVPPGTRCDILVSNPPYFPRGFLGWQLFGQQATDDSDLIPAILRHGLDYANRVVFSFSSITRAVVETGLSELSRAGSKWRMLARWRLPLNVPGPYRLSELPPGVVRTETDSKFDLWHYVYICQLGS